MVRGDAAVARLSSGARASSPGAALVALLALSSCQPSAAPAKEPQACPPEGVALTLIASRKINRDEDGEARPVQVRVYQLKTDSRLLNASFDDVWKDDKSTLKDDLVKVDEFPVYPDTRTEAKFERDEGARFVVALALFRNPVGRSFWTEFELPPLPAKGQCLSEPLHFAVWIDQTRVAEGSDHLEEFPNGAHIRELYLRFVPGQPAAKADDRSGPGSAKGQ